MKIIADTNIWYYLAQDEKLYERVKSEPISPTFINIYELARTKNLLDKEEVVRNAIRKFFNYKYEVIYTPPFIYIAQLYCKYDYDIKKEFGQILEFTSLIAYGEKIKDEHEQAFLAWVKEKDASLQDAADYLNEVAERIRSNIKNKKEHRKINAIPQTAEFIAKCVAISTQNKCDLNEFDFSTIELLTKTVDCYFKTLELSTMTMKANDWYDFTLLAYVHPGDKIWTNDKRWVRLIKEAGCEDYLYNLK